MTESALERRFVREAKLRGFVTLKLNVRGQRGWPDRLVVGPGKVVKFVELKRPNGRVDPLQSKVHQVLRRFGIEYAIVRTEGDFEKVFGCR